jgi:hypothetical protein
MNFLKKSFIFILFGLYLTSVSLDAGTKERKCVNQIIKELTDYKNQYSWHGKTAFSLQASDRVCPTLHKLIENMCKIEKLNIKTPRILIVKGNALSYLAEKLGIMNMKNDIFSFSITSNIGLICIGEHVLTGLEGQSGSRLYDDELEAVLAHELAHIKHNHTPKKCGLVLACGALATILSTTKITIPTTAATFLNEVNTELFPKPTPLPAQKTIFRSWPGITLFTTSVLGLNAYSRYCERQADETATTIIKNPSSLARSLDKIRAIQQNQGTWSSWFNSFFSTHPTIGERKRNLERIKIANNNKKEDRIKREKEWKTRNKELIKNLLNG